MKPLTNSVLTLATLCCVAGLPAQNLRRAVAAADLVVIATAKRVLPTKTHVIYRLEIEEVLRGPQDLAPKKTVSILVTKRVAVHNRPTAGKRMLYCLHDHSVAASKLTLPKSYAPFYKMSGYSGSSVQLTVGDPRLALTRVLVASQAGQASRRTAEQLFTMALRGDQRVRCEAAKSLSERQALLSCLSGAHLSQILARAAGETDDIRYKIDLAAICANRNLAATIDTLAISVEHVGAPEFLAALGRFARHIHGDEAAKVLGRYVARAKGTTKTRLIMALGATSTEGALDSLLKMKKRGLDPVVVDAALRIHGSPRATAAIAKKSSRPPADVKTSK